MGATTLEVNENEDIIKIVLICLKYYIKLLLVKYWYNLSNNHD